MVATSRSAVLRRAGSFLSLLAFEIAAVVLLTRLGGVPELRIPWHSLTPWLLNSPVEDVLAAILRSIALLIAWWLLGSNLLYLIASLTRVPSAIRAVRWLTLPVVRRATDHAVALTLATTLMSAGTGTAIAAPVAAMAPQRPGPVAAEHPSPGAAGSVAYAPTPAGLLTQPTQTTSGQPGYVPRPAGHPPAVQPRPTSTSPTSGTSPTTTGYVPRPAGPPTTTTPPRTQAPPGSSAPPTTPPTTTPPTTNPPTTNPPRTTPPTTNLPTTNPPTTNPPTTNPPTTNPPTTTGPPGGGNQQPSPSPQPPQGQPASSHRVVHGDNLWTISRDHLAAVTNRRSIDLPDHEIARYWLRVIAINRGSLQSGDPDVIFPGELIMLPPVSSGS